jgi:hypothetical protein
MEYLDRVLNFPIISRVRRNHALEHATLQILAKKNSHLSAAGYSDPNGFHILGNVSTDLLHEAVSEALHRLQAGEENLAIHPSCGTNFAATGIVAGTFAWLAMIGTGGGLRSKMERWPAVVILVTLGMIISQPLGPFLQAHFTTDGDVGELEVTEITRLERQGTPIHRIRTIH